MYELNSYLGKIKEIFSDMIVKYGFEVHRVSDHRVELVNSRCIIRVTIERYYPDLGFTFLNPENPILEKITLHEIFEKKEIYGKKIINEDRVKFLKNIDDEVEKGFYGFLYCLEFYKEILEGDFSLVEKE